MSESNAINNAAVTTADEAGREIVVSRVFDAPRELVWEAWTNPRHVFQWWGPRGFTTTIQEMDVRPGGVWKHTMLGPDGTEYPNKSVFLEVVKPERIVFSHTGGKKDAPEVKFHSTWSFVALGEKTEVTIRMRFESQEERDEIVRVYGALEGGKQTLGRLGVYLSTMAARSQPAMEDLVLTRLFDAPRELVFQAWTDPKHMVHWWGPAGYTNPVCEADVRPGGSIRIHMRAPDGVTYLITGEYLEIAAPERIVFTEQVASEDGTPLFTVRNTVILVAEGNKTTVTVRSQLVESSGQGFSYFSGMETGWSQMLDRLQEYVTTN